MPISETTYTRMANADTYAANDALSNSTITASAVALTFDGCAAKRGGSGVLTGVTGISGAAPTLPLQLTLFIFGGTAAPTATADNAEFNLSDANAANLIDAVAMSFAPLDVTAGTNGNAFAVDPATGDRRPYTCAADDTLLYGLVRVANAYIPVASEVLRFRLHWEPQ
jgi:hypothetical protein